MSRGVRAAVTAALGIAYLVLLVTALVPAPVPFLLFAAGLLGAELWLGRQAPYLLPSLLQTQLGTRFRLLSLDVLTGVLAARLLPDAVGLVALAVLAVLALHGGRDTAGIFARRLEWRRNGGPVSWRNLDVPGLPTPRTPRPVEDPSVPLALLSLIMPLGFAVGWFTDRLRAAAVAELVVLAVVVLFLAGRLVQYVLENRVGRDAVRTAVRRRLETLAPEVVLHHSGRRGTAEQVLGWVPSLAALGRPALILVREPAHLDLLDGCGLPVVFAPRSQDVELFMVPSVDVALYPSTVTNINNHLLRVPGIYDVLVGHGDSDEQENRSPIARMYDEVWVAGPLGRERYAYPASGVRPDRICEIGTPPVASGAVPAGRRPTVLYAPTWEHVLDSTNCSSLLTSGAANLDALLGRQDVRVLFAPARSTGSRLPEYADTADRLRVRVEAAGLDHAVVAPEDVPAALASASLVITDVSTVLSDAIRADVPVAVPALPGRTAVALRTAFPTLAAATVLREPRDVLAAVDDALGADVLRATRRSMGARIAGEPGDFAARFAAAVNAAAAAQRRRRAFARPTAAASAASPSAPSASTSTPTSPS
ncbi:MAG: hypothetical protein QOC59_1282 [Microbacteriaceae bacterium]|nr:hypothetical protein [Microbacteriaceae bacterium]